MESSGMKPLPRLGVPEPLMRQPSGFSEKWPKMSGFPMGRRSLFVNQTSLSPRQVRWQQFLGEFNQTLRYVPGKADEFGDGLCRIELMIAHLLHIPAACRALKLPLPLTRQQQHEARISLTMNAALSAIATILPI
jgi:hypothetical protein